MRTITRRIPITSVIARVALIDEERFDSVQVDIIGEYTDEKALLAATRLEAENDTQKVLSIQANGVHYVQAAMSVQDFYHHAVCKVIDETAADNTATESED